jgi:hypothetical protein
VAGVFFLAGLGVRQKNGRAFSRARGAQICARNFFAVLSRAAFCGVSAADGFLWKDRVFMKKNGA